MKLYELAILTGLVVIPCVAQNPGDSSKVPQQLKLERQNELLRLQHDQDKIQNDYNATGCGPLGQKAQQDYQAVQVKINDSTKAGLKELNLDPEKYIVQPNTFYVVDKPTPPPPAAP